MSLRFASVVLLLFVAACSAHQIPIVGAFLPGPQDDMIRQSQANQRDAMLNYTFRPNWKSLVDDHKYKAALALIEAHKGELGETNEKTFIEDTHRECRNYLSSSAARFRRNLLDLKSQKDLAAMKSDEFGSNFAVPPPDELISTNPVYEWTRTYGVAFLDFRSRKPSGESLLKAVAASASLPADDDGENRWFDTMETLVYGSMAAAIKAEVEKSQDAPKAEREESRLRAESLHNQWTGLVESLEAGSKNRKRVGDHDVLLGKLREGFPKDLPELSTIDLSACLSGTNPEADLQKVERTLKGLDSRGGITRESRQRLYTLLVTAVSLRIFFQGKEEADAVAEVKGYAESLKKAGGPTDTRAFGARVQSVFEMLLR